MNGLTKRDWKARLLIQLQRHILMPHAFWFGSIKPGSYWCIMQRWYVIRKTELLPTDQRRHHTRGSDWQNHRKSQSIWLDVSRFNVIRTVFADWLVFLPWVRYVVLVPNCRPRGLSVPGLERTAPVKQLGAGDCAVRVTTCRGQSCNGKYNTLPAPDFRHLI